MKIEVLKLIENALIGGKNGEMSYIYNNPFIFELFNQWKNKRENFHIHKNDENVAFKEFLKECLKEDTVEANVETPKVIGYKTLTKEYDIDTYDEDYKIYKEKETQINLLQKQKQKILSTLAHKLNPALAPISSYEIESKYSTKKLVFSFNVELVLKENEEIKENKEKEENK